MADKDKLRVLDHPITKPDAVLLQMLDDIRERAEKREVAGYGIAVIFADNGCMTGFEIPEVGGNIFSLLGVVNYLQHRIKRELINGDDGNG